MTLDEWEKVVVGDFLVGNLSESLFRVEVISWDDTRFGWKLFLRTVMGKRHVHPGALFWATMFGDYEVADINEANRLLGMYQMGEHNG